MSTHVAGTELFVGSHSDPARARLGDREPSRTPKLTTLQNKLLLVSPCQGTYGGIEAFLLAVAEAVRHEKDFSVKICFKKVKGFSLHPSLAEMLRGQPTSFVDRAGGELARAVQWADAIHLQNAS